MGILQRVDRDFNTEFWCHGFDGLDSDIWGLCNLFFHEEKSYYNKLKRVYVECFSDTCMIIFIILESSVNAVFLEEMLTA